jgi:UDP-N-acetylglucosamine 2-epimerase (non-hydrolysing)
MKLLNHAKAVLTDSGGIQKEAYILKVPCITMMAYTPWVETVAEGWNVLVGNDKRKIIAAIQKFNPSNMRHGEIFGKGNAAKEIVKILNNPKL